MRVSVYHNVARDEQGRMINFDGYEPGHPLVLVFEAEIDLGTEDPLSVLVGEVWTACNLDPDQLTGRMATLAHAYRARRLRSLSVGDVLMVGDDDRTVMRVDPVGFTPVNIDQVNVVTTGDHGTRPWSTDVRPLHL
jgi:hypothetical protein